MRKRLKGWDGRRRKEVLKGGREGASVG